jgi:hypothetical protein
MTLIVFIQTVPTSLLLQISNIQTVCVKCDQARPLVSLDGC